MAILTAISASFVAIATLEVSFVDDYFAVGAYMQLEWGRSGRKQIHMQSTAGLMHK